MSLPQFPWKVIACQLLWIGQILGGQLTTQFHFERNRWVSNVIRQLRQLWFGFTTLCDLLSSLIGKWLVLVLVWFTTLHWKPLYRVRGESQSVKDKEEGLSRLRIENIHGLNLWRRVGATLGEGRGFTAFSFFCPCWHCISPSPPLCKKKIHVWPHVDRGFLNNT